MRTRFHSGPEDWVIPNPNLLLEKGDGDVRQKIPLVQKFNYFWTRGKVPVRRQYIFDDARVFLEVEHMCTKKRG